MLVAYRYGSLVILGGQHSGDVQLISKMLSSPGLLYLSRREQKPQQQQWQPLWVTIWSGMHTQRQQEQQQEAQQAGGAGSGKQRGDALGSQILKNWVSQMQRHAYEDERVAQQELHFQSGMTAGREGLKRVVKGLSSMMLATLQPLFRTAEQQKAALNMEQLEIWRWKGRQQVGRQQVGQPQQELNQQNLRRQQEKIWEQYVQEQQPKQQQQQQQQAQVGQRWLGPSPSSETMKVVVEPFLDEAVKKGRDRLLVKVGLGILWGLQRYR